ncbi:MAG: hypothetical protein HY779_03980 [Rubrobacteridae bacterium]|nr:hypothetical protein [Rubrobacteridae bacterium]
MYGLGVAELGFLIMIVTLIFLPTIAVWKIASKAGLSPWISLTQLFPPLNLVGLFYIAFSEWPAARDEQNNSAIS